MAEADTSTKSKRRARGDGYLNLGQLPESVQLLHRRTTQELVADVLREAILGGKLRGGTRLVQERLAHELLVSRVPVREALLQLDSEGLVEMEPHRGAVVTYHSPDEIEELFEIRTLLVRAAVAKSVPLLGDAEIARLRDIAARQETETNMRSRSRLNREFYEVLFGVLKKPLLVSLMNKYERVTERYLMPIARPHLGHRALVEACASRDGELAAQIVGEHLEQVGRRAVERVRELARPSRGSA